MGEKWGDRDVVRQILDIYIYIYVCVDNITQNNNNEKRGKNNAEQEIEINEYRKLDIKRE